MVKNVGQPMFSAISRRLSSYIQASQAQFFHISIEIGILCRTYLSSAYLGPQQEFPLQIKGNKNERSMYEQLNETSSNETERIRKLIQKQNKKCRKKKAVHTFNGYYVYIYRVLERQSILFIDFD